MSDIIKRALVVGIDHYSPDNQLYSCVGDAVDLAKVLSRNDDESLNFHCKMLTSDRQNSVTKDSLREAIKEYLFGSDATCVLLYLAGHSATDPRSSETYFITLIGKFLRSLFFT